MNKGLLIRKATERDLPKITAIYNEAILNTTATFDTKEKNLAEQEIWFKSHCDKYPVLVVEKDKNIIAWGSLSPWSDRCAYSETAEISFYVEDKQRGKGIGKLLLKKIIETGKEAGLHTLLSRVVTGNKASTHLHQNHGFVLVGTMREVGKKFGRLHDVDLWQYFYQ